MSEEKQSTFDIIRNAEGLLVMIILALILWVSKTTYDNSIVLAKMQTQMSTIVDDIAEDADGLKGDVIRIDERLESIWPRLREMKERIQHLEAERPETDSRAHTPWRY